MSTKVCRHCLVEKPLTDFHTRTVNGRKQPYVYCKSCRSDRQKGRPSTYRYTEEERAYYRERSRRRHSDPDLVGVCVLKDCKQSDRKKSRPNDLDLAFVETLIRQPCSYCGETDIRMTLDRIDNAGGHTKDNVIQACYRCNHTRRDMPAEAWAFLVEGMRLARLAGAFGEWASKPFSRKREQ